jgi:hypothetical protein
MRRYGWIALGLAVAFVGTKAVAQDLNSIEAHSKQDGLIEEPPSADPPMPFTSARAGLDILAHSSTFKVLADHPEQAMTVYDRTDGVHESFQAFTKGSMFYPSVVRMRFVVTDKPSHIEKHRVILCEADATMCARLRFVYNAIDKQCGVAIPGCPGYIEPAYLHAKRPLVQPPPPPPPSHP